MITNKFCLCLCVSGDQRVGLVSGLGPSAEPITSVEEFVPDGGMLDRSFLDDTTSGLGLASPLHEQDSDRWVQCFV